MVSKLLTLSLAQGQNHTTGECCLSLHPMIRDWLQSRIAESDRSVYVVEAINLLANYIDANVQESSLREARGILGHLDACMSSQSKLKIASCRLGFGHLRKHGLIFSSFYMSHGRYREAVEGLQAVLEHDIQVYGQKHAHTFRTVRQLADALVHGGQYHKAHDMLSKAFNDSKDVADLETLHIVSAMAGVLAKLDRQVEAEKCYEAALTGHKLRKDSAKTREVYLLYERLAEVKQYLGKHGEAEGLYLEAHKGHEQYCAYDEDATLDMLRTAGGLANLHRTLGRYAEAEVSYREAWQGYKMYHGVDYPKTLVMLTNLAISCRNQGKFEDADNYFHESVRVFQKSLGPDHPDSLRALMNLSISMDKQGHYKEAESKYWEILKGREKKLGLNHPHTRRTLERLAHMLWMQGNYDKAESLVRKVLTKAGRSFDQSQPSSSTNKYRFPALIALYTEARQRDQSKLAPDHVDALETCECLRLVYSEQGEYEKAKELADQIQAARKITEPTYKQGKPDDVRKPSTSELDQHDLERSTKNGIIRSPMQEFLRHCENNHPGTWPVLLLLLGLLFWSSRSYWLNPSNSTNET